MSDEENTLPVSEALPEAETPAYPWETEGAAPLGESGSTRISVENWDREWLGLQIALQEVLDRPEATTRGFSLTTTEDGSDLVVSWEPWKSLEQLSEQDDIELLPEDPDEPEEEPTAPGQ